MKLRACFFPVIVLAILAACTPQQQDFKSPAQGSTFSKTTFIAADGAALPMRRWLPKQKPKAVIVALHGMNDYSNAFSGAGDYFAPRRIAFYAYDQRGFGAGPQPGIWAGEDNLVRDLADVVRAAKAKHPGAPVYILGESMGGAVAIAALSRADFPAVNGLILSAPALWGDEAMNPFYRSSLWLLAHIMPYKKFDGSDLDILASNNIPMLRALGRDPLIIKDTRADAIYGLVRLMDTAYEHAPKLEMPVLLLYGGTDQVIPPEPINATVSRMGKNLTYRYYPDSYHMMLRDLQGEKILSDIAKWIGNPRALPDTRPQTPPQNP